MQKITILVPAYNEEEVLEIFYQKTTEIINNIKDYKFEILFINDGSKDNTLNIIKDLAKKDNRISYVDLSRNFGKEIAMAAGIDYVDADGLIIMDADLQDPPSLIPMMIEKFKLGYDDVYAKRRSRAGESFVKKFTSKLYYEILQKFTRVQIQKDTGDFRLLSRKAISSLKQFKESQRYTKGLFSLIGHKKIEILFDRDPRVAGSTKWNYIKLMGLAIDGITSFTTIPLRFATFVGILASAIGFLWGIKIIIQKLFFGIAFSGYASLMCAILFIGGANLLFLGILGEYIGRIFLETKARPLYFINEYHSGDGVE